MMEYNEKQFKRFMKKYNLKELNKKQINWIKDYNVEVKQNAKHLLMAFCGLWIINIYTSLVNIESTGIYIVSAIISFLIYGYIIKLFFQIKKINKSIREKFEDKKSKYRIK